MSAATGAPTSDSVKVGRTRPGATVLPGLLVLMVGCIVLALSTGAVAISLWDMISGTVSELEATVFSEIRSPRVLLAGLVGATLALSGSKYCSPTLIRSSRLTARIRCLNARRCSGVRP